MSKKVKTKKASKKVESNGVVRPEVVGTKKTTIAAFQPAHRGKTTKFAAVLAEAAKLKEGEALQIELDKKDKKSITNTRNWLAALVKKDLTPAKGTRFVVRMDVTGLGLAILCESID